MIRSLYLFSFTLFLFFSNNVTSNDYLMDYETEVPNRRQFITEEELLNEIEATQKQLDELVSEGRLSASAAIAASGALATLAFGVFRIVNWFQNSSNTWIFSHSWEGDGEYDWDDEMGIKPVIINCFQDSILPALGIGGLIGYSNYRDEELPSLNTKDSKKVGLKTFLTGLGISFILSGTRLTNEKYFSSIRLLTHAAIHGLTAYSMFNSVITSRQERQQDIFDLKTQLALARRKLAQLRGEVEPADNL